MMNDSTSRLERIVDDIAREVRERECGYAE